MNFIAESLSITVLSVSQNTEQNVISSILISTNSPSYPGLTMTVFIFSCRYNIMHNSRHQGVSVTASQFFISLLNFGAATHDNKFHVLLVCC